MSKQGVLSIAGVDPSGGAGLLADTKVFHQMGATGFGACTAITYQNEDELSGINWISWEQIRAQLEPLFTLYSINVVKIGIVENLEVLHRLLKYLRTKTEVEFVVWDPVMVASSGYRFHTSLSAEVLKDCMGMVDVVTPNQFEMEEMMALLGMSRVEELARYTNVIAKGGHLNGQVSEDTLYMVGGRSLTLTRERLKTTGKRGTGCSFSSAMAAAKHLGNSLEDSFEMAKTYVYELLKNSEEKLGNHHDIKLNVK